jgi:hypothetical protein
MKSLRINGHYIYCIQQYACAKIFKARGIFGIAHIANEEGQYDPVKGQCLFINKEGEALRCKIGPTFYQKIMLDIE